MKPVPTIKKNKEFRSIYQKGKSVANRNLVLYYRKNPQVETRIGITVSKKVGKSVVRNKVKRRLKEILREKGDQLPKGYDLVWIARISCSEADYHTLQKAVTHLLNRTFFSKNRSSKKSMEKGSAE
ncbi:ribonuclease P protein component [Tindallia magadiensis]|uniref:Ribonuclease P protein component n=1 Tax=Tindallia magadiensis TaxID=69895 RepID=A0A1I3G8J9_9FIRM|nr:ribonuclease P protein component [Tindallia magadiensis]SFI19744.1 ribonuclease P protein component [Tindallia magadiensis]